MRMIRIEMPVPDDTDPSDILADMTEKAIEIWEDWFDANPGHEDVLRNLIENEVSVQELLE